VANFKVVKFHPNRARKEGAGGPGAEIYSPSSLFLGGKGR